MAHQLAKSSLSAFLPDRCSTTSDDNAPTGGRRLLSLNSPLPGTEDPSQHGGPAKGQTLRVSSGGPVRRAASVVIVVDDESEYDDNSCLDASSTHSGSATPIRRLSACVAPAVRSRSVCSMPPGAGGARPPWAPQPGPHHLGMVRATTADEVRVSDCSKQLLAPPTPPPGGAAIGGGVQGEVDGAALTGVLSLVRKLSQAFFANQGEQPDLMNDWELAGNKNSWVCPSDRHLALRAQLKSGWSMHTSRQKAKKANANGSAIADVEPTGITDAERAQIAAVLAKADQTKSQEEGRIGKLVDRLSNMRRQAVGNGVTQCMLCCADFGLLGSMRSYGAMCYDCRKYVCQKTCGVDCYDQKLRETVFLCKLCSESREIWKKTGAWFYHDLPKHTLPAVSGGEGRYEPRRSVTSRSGGPSWARNDDRFSSNDDADGWADRQSIGGRSSRGGDANHENGGRRSFVSRSPSQCSSYGQPSRRRQQPPIPPDPGDASNTPTQRHTRSDSYRRVLPKVPQQEPSRPSPRIQPRWVTEQVGSSMSYDETSSDEDSRLPSGVMPAAHSTGPSSTAREGAGGVVPRWASSSSGGQPQGGRRAHLSGSIRGTAATGGPDPVRGGSVRTPRQMAAAPRGDVTSVQRINIARRKHTLEHDSESDAAPAESQSPTPPSSPRRSLATPSSHGGDGDSRHEDVGGGGGGALRNGGAGGPDADSRSIDSGVVQSDHSQSTTLARPSSSLLRPQTSAGNAASTSAGVSAVGVTSGGAEPTSEDSAFPQSASQEAIPPHEAPVAFPLCSSATASSPPLHKTSTSKRPSIVSAVSSALHSSLSLRRSDGPAPLTAGDEPPGARRTVQKHSQSIVSSAELNLPSSPEDDQTGPPPSCTSTPKRPPSSTSTPKRPRLPATARVSFVEPMDIDDVFEYLDRHPRAPAQGHAPLKTAATTLGVQTGREPPAETPAVRKRSMLSDVLARGFVRGRGEREEDDDDIANLGTVEFTLNFNPEDHTLTVHMLSAKGLRAMDSNGLSDPFVKLNLLPGGTKSTKLRTKTITKTLNPEWNEELIYYGVTEEDKNKKTLRIQIMDEDRIGSDFLGETRIPLKKITANKERRFNVYLEKQMPVDVKSSHPDLQEPGKILLTLQFDASRPALLVGVVRCAELVGMDGSGYSDPYCRIALMPLTTKAHRVKTKVKRKTCNPEWNEEFALRVAQIDLASKTLELSVFDRDVGRHDDYIGGLVLGSSCKGERGRHWNKCIQNPGQKFKSWHRLTPEHTGAG